MGHHLEHSGLVVKGDDIEVLSGCSGARIGDLVDLKGELLTKGNMVIKYHLHFIFSDQLA